MPDMDLTGVFVAAAFFAVLAIAAVIGLGVSWCGYPTASLWITGAGVVLGVAAGKAVRAACH